MRRVSIVGIGAGGPDDITVAAIKALDASDVLFVVEKPGARSELSRARREIVERHLPGGAQRTVAVEDPARDRGAAAYVEAATGSWRVPTGRSARDRDAAAYVEAVEDWRRRRADVWEAVIRDELADGERGAFLVWGDPALYDSTIAVLDDVAARGSVAFEPDVVAGISAISALTARHRIALNRVGGAVQITTGRRLAAGFPSEADDVVVMLDSGCAFADVDPNVEIWWGAYLGTDDEILVAGRVGDVADEIVRVRAAARERKGWIMDTYLLRRAPSAAPRRPS